MTHEHEILPRALLYALLGTLAAVLAPHVLRMPPWVGLLVIVCAGWRVLIARRAWRLPPGWLRTLLTLAAAGGIMLQHGSVFGRDAGTALLAVMAVLKLLEMRSRRDVVVVLYLTYFLILTQFFYSQSIPNLLYLLGTVWATTTMLIAAQAPSRPLRRHLRLAAVTLLQAAPLMLLLFVLFPRLPGPLWALPNDAGRGTTGLSEEMQPGRIGELSRSGEVAFRVRFEDTPPQRDTLYWRGPVLADYDGKTWRRGGETARAVSLEGPADTLRYSITLQPTGQRWVLGLDRPVVAPEGAELNERLELVTRDRVSDTRHYSLESAPAVAWPVELSRAERARYLALPAGHHPRARAVAENWRRRGLNDQEIMAEAVRFFATRPFVYTLTPQRLDGDVVDQFLFDTQRGFCEHYASAFVVLLRSAGVPARVVTGYMGGEMNPLGDYMIVRQSDAHAWTEVWLEGQGWLRADPTGLVAPQRIEYGLADAVGEDEPVPAIARRSESFTRVLQLRWDALQQGWDMWVLGYGPATQRAVLSRLGLRDARSMGFALLAALALALLTIAALLLRSRGPELDQAAQLYRRFGDRLARQGLERQPQESPSDFAARVATARPDLAEEVARITRLYLAARYGDATERQMGRQLQAAVERFRPSAPAQRPPL